MPTQGSVPEHNDGSPGEPQDYSLEAAEPHHRVWALLLAGGVYLLAGQLCEALVAAALAAPEAVRCCDECRALLRDFDHDLSAAIQDGPGARSHRGGATSPRTVGSRSWLGA